ncbi:zinc finger CCCH domain-containing protein 30 [Cannabis sativa]|uniref:zinc finger CCCH domain-containing protein 30 n=1 Tax=Cannabis sativa TaxID=3483 RepID=UPI0029C9DCBF|nr:zinc finger CCCH domain-containing protein 30 [Cannabis sativa]XP_030493212.2 zinc finger CCCH domain-containing protein 30 [Cannabis sativa]
MCCGSEKLKPISSSTPSPISIIESRVTNIAMNHLTIQTEDTFASLLELAANNDIDGFKRSIERDPSSVDEPGLWYGRQKGSKVMVNEQRTPLMVAATYGSIDVVQLILSLSVADVNFHCGLDRSTALHCAASGGAKNAVDVVKLLLAAGADPNLVDGNGHFPLDVIVVHPKLQDVKLALEELLKTNGSAIEHTLTVSTRTVNSRSPTLSSSSENGSPLGQDFNSSPSRSKFIDFPVSEKKEYPVDPSLPDIKNSIYSTDEFRMYSFKVRPCSRAYSHDWTECPFVHPGENARRRDPRKFHYSCVPCPEFRKGACRRGDMCEYAHGVFECWLHPAQYRTRLCKDGTSCARRVCFFAHTPEELRPLYVSTGSAVPSPRTGTSGAAAMDFAAAMNMLPGSPSSMSVMSPSPFTPPISPSGNGMSHASGGWPQPNVPALHLPGSNLQSSRLRSSLNARDIPTESFDLLSDFDMQQQHQLLNELSCLSQPSFSSNSLNRSGRMKTLTPSNLDDLFSAESSSPRYSDQGLPSAVFSPTHKSAVINQFQQQQTMLSPINTNFSPKNDHPLMHQSSFGAPSSGRMSPRNMEPISPMGSRVSMLAQRDKQQFRSLSSRELGSNSASTVGSPVNSWSKWGSSNGKPDWAVSTDELGKHRRSSSFELGNNGEEPDLSWVQSLVKESPTEMKEKSKAPISGVSANNTSSNETEGVDHAVLGAWLEQMQLDHLVAQQN